MDVIYIFGVVWGYISTTEVLGVNLYRSVLAEYGYQYFSWCGCYICVDIAIFSTNRKPGVALKKRKSRVSKGKFG